MDGPLIDRRVLALGALGLMAPGSARAGTNEDYIRSRRASPVDRFGRLTLLVEINDVGPFQFALDSAATLSVIAADLAADLGLADAGDVQMHTLLAAEYARTVRADRIRCGSLDERGARLAVGSRAALGGLDGLISAGSLNDRRVVMSFRGDRMTIGRGRTRDQSMFSDEHRIPFYSPAIGGFNNLVIVGAHVNGVAVNAIIDTGAQSTIANSHLVRAVGGEDAVMPDGSRTQLVQSATGRSADARTMVVRNLHMGPLTVARLPVLMGDFHTFDVWGLGRQPALLIGMDLLGKFQTVSIDFNTRTMIFAV